MTLFSSTRRKLFLFFLLLPLASPAAAVETLPPMREQHAIRQEWVKERLEKVVPALMRKHGVAMWLVVCREYHEDPVFFSLVSPSTMAARRRTILVFFDRGGDKGVERLAPGGGSNGGLYTVYRDPEVENRELWGNAQWALLRKLVDEKKPASIAVDVSKTHAFSDGLSAGDREELEEALGPWREKIVRAELLPLEVIETRVPGMLPTYRRMMGIAHAIIAKAFSAEVITPGVTTTEDVVWWMRQRVNDMGLGEWFPPTVDVQRPGVTAKSSLAETKPVVIQRGDVLHCDFGIRAMGLNTDTQHMAYVLKDGESDAPEGLRNALANSNRLQDIVLARMKPGRTGNEVLLDALAAAKAAGLEGTVYTHPIGDHGHGAGPIVGLWDRQQAIPGRGDVKLIPSAWFSIELQATTPVPEWGGQPVSMMQEEDAAIAADGTISFVLPRQTKLHLVR